jgi:hypothetical protein
MNTKKQVLSLPNEQTHEWILKKHYAHRIPSISYAFGLYIDEILSGVVTYGTPASSPLRIGIAGDKWMDKVIELNRLVINDDCPKNSASFLVGNSLKLLPKPCIVVSFADIGQGHIGYIYQACNFIYTGLSAKRTNWIIEGMENLHSITIADQSRGQQNRAQFMRDKYGDKFKLEPRSRKHRYIFICANKKDKWLILDDLRYKVQEYPKGNTHRYDASYNPATQGILI